jgi:fatty-acyl-CoA synthase
MTHDIIARRKSLRQRFPSWYPRTLSNFLDRCAVLYGDRPFVLSDSNTMSYSAVADESLRIAWGLSALGVRAGDRVGLLLANYPEFVTLKFAIARLGAIAVPFNYFYRSDELRYVLADSRCSVLAAMTDFGSIDYQDMLDDVIPGWDTGAGADQSPTQPRHVVMVPTGSNAPRAGALTLGQLRVLGRHDVFSRIGPDTAADILYTSGTTGFPKGVVLSHDSVLRTAYASALTRAFEDGRRILFSLPCYHMFGYIEGLLAAMFVGGSVVLQPSFDPQRYFDAIASHRVTDMLCVPTMAVALLEHPARADADLGSLRAILCGSAPAPLTLWEQLRETFGVDEIVTGYGMTECGGAMTLTLPEDTPDAVVTTVGRPKLAGAAGVAGSDQLTDYRAVDPDTGQQLGAGVPGVLESCGPTTMLGYWNRAQDTAEVLRGGWMHSGDIGSVRSDGYLTVTGRSKELYKSGGELVMPKEIEDLLTGYADISQAYAIGLPDERWGEIGCVVIVPVQPGSLTEDEVLARCKNRLARFKVPKKVVFATAESLPTTPTGKVQKFRLARQLVMKATAQN